MPDGRDAYRLTREHGMRIRLARWVEAAVTNYSGVYAMVTNTASAPPASTGRRIFAVFVTWVLTRLLFSALDFHYAVFSDPFDAEKLALDLGAWIAVYVVVSWVLIRPERA